MPNAPADNLSRYATLTDATGTVAVDPRQSAQPVTVLNQASAAQTATGNSGSLNTSGVARLEIDINVTAATGTSPSLTPSYQQQGADGVWYTVWTGTAITAAGSQRTSIGPGLANQAVVTSAGRLVWTITGTTPSFTFSASIIGR